MIYFKAILSKLFLHNLDFYRISNFYAVFLINLRIIMIDGRRNILGQIKPKIDRIYSRLEKIFSFELVTIPVKLNDFIFEVDSRALIILTKWILWVYIECLFITFHFKSDTPKIKFLIQQQVDLASHNITQRILLPI